MTPEHRSILARAVADALDSARVRLPPRAHARFIEALCESLDDRGNTDVPGMPDRDRPDHPTSGDAD